jgi:hypothetical protein
VAPFRRPNILLGHISHTITFLLLLLCAAGGFLLAQYGWQADDGLDIAVGLAAGCVCFAHVLRHITRDPDLE